MLHYIIFGLISFISILYYILTAKFNYWKNRNIPGLKPVLFFGNIKDSAIRKENAAETLHKIYKQFPNEPVVGLFRMTNPCLLLRDLDVIKNVMIKDFDVFEARGIEFSKEGLGANLFHADGDIWRALRHKLTPIFTTGKLKGLVYLVEQQSDKFMTFLEDSVSKRPEQEMYYHFKRFTISTITTCAFGLSVNTMNEELMKTLAEIDKATLETNMYQELDMMFPKLLRSLNISLFPARVQNFVEEMVSTVITERKGKPSARNDLMDFILEIRQQKEISSRHETKQDAKSITLTDSIIAAQAFVFYFAGYETSATLLSFLFYELARNPEIQDKAIEEVDKVLKKHNGKITYETISDLDIVERCFLETYRKYPVVPLQRKATADYKVPGTDITIKKDTIVAISALGIHYDEKYYPNPEVFDPDRFTTENSKDRHVCAFLPYGAGPRNCIGLRFGKIQTRVCAIKLLSKFRIAPSPISSKITFDPKRIIINPEGGIHVKLIPRT